MSSCSCSCSNAHGMVIRSMVSQHRYLVCGCRCSETETGLGSNVQTPACACIFGFCKLMHTGIWLSCISMCIAAVNFGMCHLDFTIFTLYLEEIDALFPQKVNRTQHRVAFSHIFNCVFDYLKLVFFSFKFSFEFIILSKTIQLLTKLKMENRNIPFSW